MTPTNFPEASQILGPPPGMDQPVASLPIWTDDQQCVSCWRPTWRERLSVLFFGRVWVQVMSGRTQPPIAVSASRSIFVRS
jgi:hypothetical protein